jgi:hypothetical protein
MRQLRRGAAAFILLSIALLGGPGLAALEAIEHLHRSAPGHGLQSHLELPGAQDHDDSCGAWLGAASARTPAVPAAALRTPDSRRKAACVAGSLAATPAAPRLPPSRAPPRSV